MKGNKATVGDWVRFCQDGRLVIGEVRYVEDTLYCTDLGWTCEVSVLEVRGVRKEEE